MTRIILETDLPAVRLPGGARHPVSEDTLAALYLLAMGYGLDALGAWVADPEGALDGLRAVGLNPEKMQDAPPVLVCSGHTFVRQSAAVRDRLLAGKVAQRADRDPDADAILLDMPDDAPVAITRAELSEMVLDVAGHLAGAGIGPGQHIAVAAEPSLESLVVLHAAWAVGISAVLIRDGAQPVVIDQIAARMRPAIWFVTRQTVVPDPATVVFLDAEGDETGIDDWLADGPVAQFSRITDPETEAVVVASSGSTGVPKLLALSQRALFHAAHILAVSLPDVAQQRLAATADLTAMSSLRAMAVMPAVTDAAAIVLTADTRNSSLGMLAAFARCAATYAVVVPATLRAAAQLGARRFAALGLDQLAVLSSATGVLHQTVYDRVAAAYPGDLRDTYGMNESAGAFAWATTGALSARGGVSQNMLVRIVRADGTACAPGETGQIRLFGEGLFLGEYGPGGFEPRPKGWFTTGDVGCRLENGGFRITGRSHDLIKSRDGEFLSPIALENAVMALDDVQEAVIVPLPATEAGELFGLVVQSPTPQPGLEPRLRGTIEHQFGPYATPEKYVVLSQLPRAANGKPDRTALAEILLDQAD